MTKKTYSEYIRLLEERISFTGVKFTKVTNVKKAESYLTSYFDIISIDVFSLKIKRFSNFSLCKSFTLY
ncbi:DNA mismatch repair protein MutS [Fusobacterium animalis ATCC 51191]|uniref:DNA mismatch repair protein MutS n=1 Tax=Fusobacterium animalis ATCC 51191 TaxID=997347 RepID=F9EQH7_9FUSO|nr:DNA mismatch repair protein MutS [Fusobacterium animalis ATCC 51191]